MAIATREDAYKALCDLRATRDQLATFDRLTELKRSTITGAIASIEGKLRDWASVNLDGKSKTIDLLIGKVSFRTVPGGLRVVDTALALNWAKEHRPELVKTETTVRCKLDSKGLLGLVAAATIEDGPLDYPPGVALVADEEKFTVTIAEEEDF